jgi:hypothetical protein
LKCGITNFSLSVAVLPGPNLSGLRTRQARSVEGIPNRPAGKGIMAIDPAVNPGNPWEARGKLI